MSSNRGKTHSYITDDGVRFCALDKTFKALLSIDVEHHEIHDGSSYQVTAFATGVGSGSIADFFGITPANVDCHFVFSVSGSGELEFALYEGATVSSNGTPMSVINRNRKSIKTSTMQAFHTPTVTGVGTLLESGYFGTGKTVGGSNHSDTEMILKNNTNYLVRITSRSSANNISGKFMWYEHNAG